MSLMNASDIYKEVQSMDFTNPRAVVEALVHIAEKLVELEHAMLVQQTKESQQ